METTNINSLIVNQGSGSVNLGDIKVERIDQKIAPLSDPQKEFLEIVKQIEKLTKKGTDEQIKQALLVIQEETKQTKWRKHILEFALDIIKSVAVNITTEAILPLVSKAASLLPQFF